MHGAAFTTPRNKGWSNPRGGPDESCSTCPTLSVIVELPCNGKKARHIKTLRFAQTDVPPQVCLAWMPGQRGVA
eukprot:2995647-Alexandrium_andersonii.AAC.1